MYLISGQRERGGVGTEYFSKTTIGDSVHGSCGPFTRMNCRVPAFLHKNG